MVSSITRNWVGGLSSGMDTQSLIDKIMESERIPVDRLEQKRNKISLQKSMLQDINLKLFDLQSKATDLIFSRTFNTKTVTSSSDKNLSAVASTSAKVGSYTLNIKQLATTTKVSSSNKLAGTLELGNNLESSTTLGGANVTLGAAGVTAGDLTVTVSGSGVHTLSLGLSAGSSMKDMITSINTKISANSELKGKIVANFDESANQIKFNLLDSTKTIDIEDAGGGTIINKMFNTASKITLDKNTPVSRSTLTSINSGSDTTLNELGVSGIGTMTLQRTAGPLETLDLTGISSSTSIDDVIDNLNHQIDKKASLTKSGIETGNPDDRLVEFRYDEGSGKLRLVNTSSADSVKFTLTDGTGNFTSSVFGASTKTSDFDEGETLSSASFSTTPSSGTFTVDGVQITIDNQSDTLQDVMERITSSTNISASYDSSTDTVKFTRKDGTSNAIGLGSTADTSDFLSVVGMISGNQQGAAINQSSSNLGLTAAQAAGSQLGALSLTPAITAGTYSMRVTVNGTATDISYSDTDTLNSVLDKIENIDGIESAYYDAATGKVAIKSSDKGTSASIKIENVTGNLVDSLKLSTTTVTGTALSSSLESSKPISNIQTQAYLEDAGFSTAVTAGSFTINGVNFSISNPGSVTLQTLMTTINNNTKVGVKAEYDSTNGKFILSSTQTGNTSIALGAATDTSNFLSAMGLTTAAQDVGQNAVFSVNGMFGGADQTRQSNDVSDVVDGVTFTLKGVTDATGETVTIAADTTVSRKAIDDFITSYNDVVQTVYTKLTEEHDYTLEALTDTEKDAMTEDDLATYEDNYSIGLLSSDSTLTSVRSRMRVVMSSIVGGSDKLFDSLSDLGITTGEIGSDYEDTQVGLLEVTDEDKLTDALTNSPDKVAELFAKDSTSDSSTGIARRLKTTLNEFTKSDGILTSRVGRSGVTSSNSEMDKQITLLNDQITTQEERLQNREEALIKQYAALETAMSKYQSQSEAFSQQLAQLTGSSS